jgi:hypothetical protein
MRCCWVWCAVVCALTLSACGGNASPGDGTAASGGGAGASGQSGASGEGGGGAGAVGGTSGDSGTGGDPGAGGASGTGGGSGSGGASGTAGSDPDAGPTANAEYYPVVSGASWVYSHVPSLDPNACAAAGACWDESVTQADSDWLGGPAMLLEDDGNAPNGESSKSVLVRIGTQVLRVHRETSKDGQPSEQIDYDPGFMRFDEAWVNLPDGTEIETEYERIETVVTPGDPNLGMQTVIMRMQRFTVEAHQSLEVPAGQIDDCVRVHRVRSGLSMTGLTVDDKEKLFWFCKGIGKVREDDLTSGGHELLKSCSVPDGACPN